MTISLKKVLHNINMVSFLFIVPYSQGFRMKYTSGGHFLVDTFWHYSLLKEFAYHFSR